MLPRTELKDPPPNLIGGDGYPDTVSRSDADYLAGTQAELQDAFDRASRGDIVYIDDDIRCTHPSSGDLPNRTRKFTAPGGITIAGDRGINGSPGPRLWTNRHFMPLIWVEGNARITGFRLEGASPEYDGPHDDYPAGRGIRCTGDDIRVDNMDVYGWDYAGLNLLGSSLVTDSYFHHNAQAGLGYGMQLSDGGPHVMRRCSFDHNRHAFGVPSDGTDWTVEECWFGPDTFNHVLDHHGGSNAEMVARNITVEATHMYGDESNPEAAFGIDQTPQSLTVENCWFHHTPQARAYKVFGELNEGQNFFHSNNHYGSSEPAPGIGHPRGEQQGPVARFSTSIEGLTVVFDASNSSADAGIQSYGWDIDGASYAGRTAEHTFDTEGTYSASLTVTSNDGETDTATDQVAVNVGLPGSPTETRSLTVTGDSSPPASYTFEVLATQDGTPGIVGTGEPGPGADPGDDVVTNPEGDLWRCEGGAASGGTDTFDFTGYAQGFTAETGSYSLEVNGEPVDSFVEEPGDDDDGDGGDGGGGLSPAQRALLYTSLSGIGATALESYLS